MSVHWGASLNCINLDMKYRKDRKNKSEKISSNYFLKYILTFFDLVHIITYKSKKIDLR